MKTQKIIVLIGFMLAFLALSSFRSEIAINEQVDEIEVQVQEGLLVYATFDGKEDYGYNFVTKGKDDEEHTITFQNIEGNVLKVFDLNSDALIGTKFKITFNRDIKVSKDENNMEDEDEINTITKLEKL